MPAGVVADADAKSEAQMRREAARAQLEAEEGHDDDQEPRLSGDTARDSGDLPRGSEDTAFDENRAAALHASEIEA